MNLGLSLSLGGTRVAGGGVTFLTREANGTVTVERIGPTFTPTLAREPDGTVTVTGA